MGKEIKRLGLQECIAILALLGIGIFLVLHFLVPRFASYADYSLYVVLLLGGGILLLELLHKMVHLEFGSDLVAGVSIVTSVILEQYLAGAFVVLMLSGGQAIENYAIGTASKVLEALVKRAPTIAHLKKNGDVKDVAVEDIAIGDSLMIFPHEICPVDGEVIEGRGVMDEAYLTGEPFLLSKAPGSSVLSGAINGDQSLIIKATKLAIDSRYAKIMEVMRESEQKRPKMRRMADELGALFTPLSIL
ncbi:MAG: heavy metal translocating P-type ATPase, partial [Verrucomicrobia bacterium]|nr:heavy metal translocating P-type ATPase [Verrucomicrobiota bacterium]